MLIQIHEKQKLIENICGWAWSEKGVATLPVFSYLKLTVEILEGGMKYVQS